MKAIVFDFDGVIHDTLEDLHKVHYDILEKISIKEMIDNVFDWNPREYFDKFSPEKQREFEETWQRVYKELTLERNIREELEKLSKKYLLYIISSNNEYNLETYFENNNFLNIFNKIYWVETHKSKVEKFKILFEETKLKVDDCIFVTDTLWDILEANEVWIKTIAVDFGYHNKEKLKQGNPYKIVSSFEEIRRIIDSI